MKKYFKFIILLFVAFLAIPILAFDVTAEPLVDPEPGFNWWMIISGAFAVLSSIFGLQIKKGKAKIKDIIAFGKESLDVLFVGSEALNDNSIDAEEVQALKKEIGEAKAAWQKIWNKV